MNEYQLINLEDALDRVGGDKSLYDTLLDSFFSDNFSCENLSALLSEGKTAESAASVHRLKGASGSIGADRLYHTCAELESVLRGKKTGIISGLFSELQTVYIETIDALKTARTGL